MDDAKWDALVARWEERDRRWEERDAWFKNLARRWEERDEEQREFVREQREFMLEMWRRLQWWDIRTEARHEDMMGRLDEMKSAIAEMRESIEAGTQALWRMLDRLGEGPRPAS